MAGYDPFAAGDSPVTARTIRLDDPVRDRSFDVELWEPSGVPGPLVVYSHHSGGDRRSASYLCTHLAGHGYRVAAMDHTVPDLAGTDRIDALIAARVPDVRRLLDHLTSGPEPVGLAGHSFGGWTALATPEHDPRVDAVVALAPGGSRNPLPGILPLPLTFARGRPVPTLFLAAAGDVEIPLDRVRELFDRAPEPRRMAVLRRADHQHFADDVEAHHEALRAMTLPGDAAWIPAAMRPIGELCTGEQAHTFARGLALAHFDAELRGSRDARRFLDDGLDGNLARHAIDGYAVTG